MRVVIQRVKNASLKEDKKISVKINCGLVIYLAISQYDLEEDVDLLVEKIIKLRLFPQKGKIHDFQSSIKDVQGEILIIPNYTLYSDLSEGNRPFFGEAASPREAEKLYDSFITKIKKLFDPKKIKTGIFGAFMEVSLTNIGPTTIILDTVPIDEEFSDEDASEEESAEGFDDLLDRLGVDLEV